MVSKDMCQLSLAAELRLTTAESKSFENKRLSQKYSELLGMKNCEGIQIGETFEVRRNDISTSRPQEFINNELDIWLWKIDFFVSLDTKIVQWGRAFVNVFDGRSELLLDNRPSAWLGSPLEIRGIQVKEFIPHCDEDFRLTEAAIATLVSRFNEFYSDKQKITNFGGWLKDVNLRDFKKHFSEIKNRYTEKSIDQVAQDALRMTSFGRSRVNLGIRKFSIKLEFNDLENPDIPSEALITDAIVLDEEWDEHLKRCQRWERMFTS